MMAAGSRGKFITVEGQDGAGKTTNLDRIERLVRGSGRQVLRTREPGGTDLGNEIRRLVLHGKDLQIDAMAELLLIFAARAQHLREVMIPALDAGVWIICDRFTDATYAYQGGGRGVDAAVISELEQRVQGDLRPDLTLLFDVDIATGEMRAGERVEQDRFESEAAAFKQRVRQVYLARAKAEPKRIRIIDAARSLQEVEQEVESVLRDFIDS
jgi:dTMP kinase